MCRGRCVHRQVREILRANADIPGETEHQDTTAVHMQQGNLENWGKG